MGLEGNKHKHKHNNNNNRVAHFGILEEEKNNMWRSCMSACPYVLLWCSISE